MYEISLGLAAKTAVAIGAMILISYCWYIDYFPRDLSIGDGLLFIFIAAGFGFVYIFFVASLTSLGLTAVWLYNANKRMKSWMIRVRRRIQSKRKFSLEDLNENLPIGATCIGLTSFGILIVANLVNHNVYSIFPLGATIFLTTLLVYIFRAESSKIRQLKSRSLLTPREQQALGRLHTSRRVSVLLLIICPLAICGYTKVLTKVAMSLLNIRNESTVVDLKKPYSEIFTNRGIQGTDSEFGDEYTRFKDTKILLSGFGSQVVISMWKNCETEVKMPIPSDSIFIPPEEPVDLTRYLECEKGNKNSFHSIIQRLKSYLSSISLDFH